MLYGTEAFLQIANLLVTIAAARVLGPALFGDFAFALTLATFISTFSDFGLSTLLMKRISQLGHQPRWISSVLWLRIISSLVWLAIILGYARLTNTRAEVQMVITVMGLTVVLGGFAGLVSATLKATDRFMMDSALRMTSRAVYVLVALLTLRIRAGLLGLAVALLLATLMEGLFTYRISRQFPYPIRLFSDGWQQWPHLRQVVREALPFGLLAILGVIYFRIDTVMLQALKGSTEVGLYNAAYKILEGFLMVPWAISIVLLPNLSADLAAKRLDVVRDLVQTTMRYLIYGAFPLAMLLTLAASEVMGLLYPMPTYANAVTGLQILAWALVAVFISATTSTLISSGPSPQMNTWIAGVMVCVNVGLNWCWIPRWGLVGAAVATVVTECSGIAMNTLYIRTRMFDLVYWPSISRACVAALAMGAVVGLLKSLAFIPIYLVVYCGVLVAVGGISAEDRRRLKAAVVRMPQHTQA